MGRGAKYLSPCQVTWPWEVGCPDAFRGLVASQPDRTRGEDFLVITANSSFFEYVKEVQSYPNCVSLNADSNFYLKRVCLSVSGLITVFVSI